MASAYYDDEDEPQQGLNGPETPATFTPRGPRKGFIFDQLDAFQHMRELGADLVEAFVACISGHRMTPDLAALCIASYWRRYASIASFQESRGAAITLQAAARRRSASQAYEAQRESTFAHQYNDPYNNQYQYSTHDESVEEMERFRAMQQLQAVWRGHLARAYVDKLKYKSKSKLQRTFSWSNKSKRGAAGAKGKDPTKVKSAKDILAAAGVEESKPKPVRRSMSFDRFSRGASALSSAFSGSKKEGDAKPPAAAPTMSKQLLFILLHRGPKGLGLELDATNTVVNMVPGGAAETQGYFREGDTIASVDGQPLRGRLLQDVMDRTKNSYSFDVWRLSRVEPDPPTSRVDKPVRRAFSFDRKRR